MARIQYDSSGKMECIKLDKFRTIELECKGYTQLDDKHWIIKKDGYYYVAKNVECEAILLNNDES